ncbi:hypothetical protein [Dyadobacter diqingensis]|uniref:hypothetical protein n=1 Tax=Dyadobacter diqingensis TaxID=2938121 RepID=UPI0020C1970E|nr:hypothetical protein [Dyadobacter diqingensis]
MNIKNTVSKAIYPALFIGTILFTTSSVFAQVKIGTNPTTIDANNNLEVESSTTGNKVFIKKTGKVTIADGSQGTAKILTSDLNGEATWQTLSTLKVPTTVFLGEQASGNELLQHSNGGGIASRHTLVPGAGYTGYDVTERAYIVPEAGVYNVEVGARCGLVNTYMILAVQGTLGISTDYTTSTGSSVARVMTQTAKYAAGDKIYGFLYSSTNTNAYCWNAYLRVTRIPD